LLNEKLKKDVQRLEADLKALQALAEAGAKTIAQLRGELRAARIERDAAAERIAKLLETVRDRDQLMERLLPKIPLLEDPPAPPALPDPNRPDFKNPPPGNARGEVMAVDKNLLKISLGTDQGVHKGHTLEVYRLHPEVKYLGRIVITDADSRHSIARFITQPGTPMPQLLVGDVVGSKIMD
jgi:hypothetical protein